MWEDIQRDVRYHQQWRSTGLAARRGEARRRRHRWLWFLAAAIAAIAWVLLSSR